MSNQEREESEPIHRTPRVPELEPIPLGRYRRTWFQRITETLVSWVFFALVIGGGLYYGIHLLRNYLQIKSDFKENSARIVHPSVGENQASDIGYIYSMRRETMIREGRLNLVWFVVIPATNVHYSCPYEYGYPDFKTGDSVRLIHTTSEEDGDNGFIVGLHENERDKVASVWNFDLDTAEFDDPGDND
jgi:hypothetical protein